MVLGEGGLESGNVHAAYGTSGAGEPAEEMLFCEDLPGDILSLGKAGEQEVLGGQAPQPV